MAILAARKLSHCPSLWVCILQIYCCSFFCLMELFQCSDILLLCLGLRNCPKQRSKAMAKLLCEVLFQVMAAMCCCHERAKNWFHKEQAFISIRDQSAGLL